jgi:hypothetical protein
MATANMPSQGKSLPGSTVIKCQMGEREYSEKAFSTHLAFELQMVNICNPDERASIHLQKES